MFGNFAFQYSNAIPGNDISNFAGDRYVKVTGFVADEPSTSDEYIRFTLRADKVLVRGIPYKASGYVGIFLKDQKDPVSYGNKVSLSGKLSKIISTSNPGIVSFGDMMSNRGVRCQIFSSDHGVEVLERSIGNPIKFISIIIKNKLISVIQRTMDEPYASLLGSIVFGAHVSPLPDDLQDRYRSAGVIHFMVVAGMQVSIILVSVLAICGFFGFSPKARLVIVTLINTLFTIMVGAGPTIFRAAVMCETALIAKTFERENDLYNSLFLSALVLLMIRPLDLFDMGFQHSFVATWAMFYIVPVIKEWIGNRIPPFFAGAIAVSTAPAIATAPIIFYDLGQISFIAVISNLLITPWVEISVILGFISTLAGAVFMPIAYALNNTLTVMLALLNWLVCFFAGLPFACRYFAPPCLSVILIYYIILIGGIEMMKGRLKLSRGKATVFLAFLLCVTVILWRPAIAAADLTVTFIDVGQGDSILIESPSGMRALIDGGGRQESTSSISANKEDPVGKSIVLPFLRKKGINELALVVLTHPHDDHVGGLPYVLDKIKVGMVLDSGQAQTSRGYSRFLKMIEAKKIPYKIARAGQVIDLGSGVKGYVLNPSDPLITGTISDLNNNSVVIKLVYGKTSFLLMGDAAFEAEDRIISTGFNLKSDLLKVGHHGSRTSTSAELLDAVQPEYAVISVGARNKFGHPADETLRRLNNFGVKIFRTDRDGAVIFRGDGLKVHPQ